MKKIVLNSIEKTENKCKFNFTYDEYMTQFFSGEEFSVSYRENIESVPDAVMAVTFVCNVLPLIWLEDAELVVPELDSDFYESIPEFKNGYINMYPESEFKGKVTVGNIVDCNRETSGASLAFFSGGVDATTTLISHIEEKPFLFTIWGADIAYDNEDGWNEMFPTIEKTAENYNLKCRYVRSTFRKFDNEGILHHKYINQLGKGWWYGVKHGIGIISHAAPLVWLHGIDKIYFASSNCPEDGDKVRCASDPRIDNHIRFCGAKVFHDGFELNRQKKVKTIVDFHRKNPDIPIELHVCWQSSTGINCCHCEKCYRTMTAFWVEGEDPKNYGLNYGENVFKDMYNFMALKCNDLARNTWTYTKDRMAENWDNIKDNDYAKEIKWILGFDFKNLESNKCRIDARTAKKRKDRIRRVKRAIRKALKIDKEN